MTGPLLSRDFPTDDEPLVVHCQWCGRPCSGTTDGCIRDGYFDCDECACPHCGKHEAQEREPHEDY